MVNEQLVKYNEQLVKENEDLVKEITINDNICFNDIRFFNISNKNENDMYNKKRENIIGSIINNKIPNNFYDNVEWKNLKEQINLFIKRLCENKEIKTINSISCINKAGRGNNYDFKIIINRMEFNIEFKFNAKSLLDIPQFVSPMKPSKYLDINFEEWFYENYLLEIAKFGSLVLPNKKKYLKTIHNNKVECMKSYKDLYKSNKNFNKYCKKIDKRAIKKFIEISNIDTIKLSNYLLKNQKRKEYMFYKDGKMYYDKMNEDIYKIKNIVKRENTNYICLTESGIKIEIKLRFKNGCGLIFPAFQIKRKIPKIKELKLICKKNNIIPPKLKKDICKKLDENSIIY